VTKTTTSSADGSSNGLPSNSSHHTGISTAPYSKRQRLYSFFTQTPLNQSSASSFGGINGMTGENEDNDNHTPMEILLATLSEFFLFIKDHINSNDLEKIFYLCFLKVLLRFLIFIRDFHTFIDLMKKKMILSTSKGGSKKGIIGGSPAAITSPLKTSGSNENLSSTASGSISPSKKVFLTREIYDIPKTKEEIEKEKELEKAAVGKLEGSSDSSVVSKSPSNDENEAGRGSHEVRPSIDVRPSMTGTGRQSQMGSAPLPSRKSLWFTFNSNPLINDPLYDENIFKSCSKDSQQIMKFYSEMKQKLFTSPSSSNNNNINGDSSLNKDLSSSFDDLDENNNNDRKNRNSNDSNEGEGGGGGIDENGRKNHNRPSSMELYDDEKSSPYKQTLTILINFISHVVISSLTDDYTNESLINDFLLNGFGITLPSFSMDFIKYHIELEKLFKYDAAFIHFSPSIAMIKYQKTLSLSQIQGRQLTTEETIGLSTSPRSHSLFLSSSGGTLSNSPPFGACLPKSLCNIQIFNLAVYHVPKYKNLILVSFRLVFSIQSFLLLFF
jgi:hypothetical protein